MRQFFFFFSNTCYVNVCFYVCFFFACVCHDQPGTQEKRISVTNVDSTAVRPAPLYQHWYMIVSTLIRRCWNVVCWPGWVMLKKGEFWGFFLIGFLDNYSCKWTSSVLEQRAHTKWFCWKLKLFFVLKSNKKTAQLLLRAVRNTIALAYTFASLTSSAEHSTKPSV